MDEFMESGPDGSNNNNNNINHVGNNGTGTVRGYLDFVTDYKQAPVSHETSVSTVPERGSNSQADVEKGQQEVENIKKEQSSDEHSDNDRESDAEGYSFSEDQRRALKELMVQTEEDDDLLDEEPPEYNVKDRLIQLNEELASDPTPVEAEREHKVVFKPTVVDLVASPPPDYSDDELQTSINNQGSGSSEDASISSEVKNSHSNEHNDSRSSEHNDSRSSEHNDSHSSEHNDSRSSEHNDSRSSEHNDTPENKENFVDPNKKQFVVERDGRFSVVSANDLTSAEQDMLLDEEDNKKKAEKQIQNEKTKYKYNAQENVGDVNLATSRNITGFLTPQPPSRSRPKSVATSSRRISHQAQSPQRRSASQVNSSNTNLNNFVYTSPYAMSFEEKAAARELGRRMENERKETELQKKQEEEEKRIECESAFQAWLNMKREQEKQRLNSEMKIENSEQEKREKNEEAYKAWVKEKKTQVKRERLLKRRQQEEKMDGFFLRSREECDMAFKEWLKRKNAEVKRQQFMDRQRSRLYRTQVKSSKRTLALIRALREAQAYGYFDLHGNTF